MGEGRTRAGGRCAVFFSDFSRVREGNIFDGEEDLLDGDEGGEVDVLLRLVKYDFNGERRKSPEEWELCFWWWWWVEWMEERVDEDQRERRTRSLSSSSLSTSSWELDE